MKIRTVIAIMMSIAALGANSQQTVFSISGTALDSTNKEKLTNASILLRGESVGQLKYNTVTDDKGNFILKNILPGRYILSISHTGFVVTARQISVHKNEEIVIELIKHNTQLANIDIYTEKKLVTHTSDKITYNVSESAVNSSDNMYNIVLRVPGVVESNGSLYYQGKPLLILFDNKSNNLSGEDLKNHLSGLLGTNVDKLEILLSPSSRYGALGGAAFNIKSVMNKNYGLSKGITLGAGSGRYFRNTAGFSLNFRNQHINVYGGYDFNYQKQYFLLNAFYGFSTDPATVDLVDDNIRTNSNNSLRLGIDYDLNKKTSIGFLFRGFLNYRHRTVKNVSIYSPAPGVQDTIANANTTTNARFKSPSINIFFRKQLKKAGAELVFNGDYFDFRKKWNDDFIASYSDRAANVIAPPKHLLNNSPAHNSVKSVTADFSRPFNKGKFEAGLKLSSSKTDNDVLWQELFSNSWKTDTTKTNHFIYKENVYASYINTLINYGKFAMSAGLRFEATRARGISETLNNITKSKYDNFFPSISVQYKPGKTQQFSLNYRKSIRRPGFDIINPFIIIQGQYSFHQGNPYIKPSFFHSLELSWSYKNKLVIGSGYSAVKDPMSYAYRKDPATNTSIGSTLNFKSGKLYNSTINYTEKLVKGKWTTINSFGFLHSQMPDFHSQVQYSNSWTISSVNTILMPAKISVEVSGFYNSPMLDGTVAQTAFYGISLGLAMQVLKSKGTLKLSCTDIFDTQIRHFTIQGNKINISSDWKVESRFVNLLFTYRFGNLAVKANKNRSTGIEEEKNRMGNN